MFRRRGLGIGGWGVGLPLLAALVASGSGCRSLVDTVAGVFGPGEVGGTVDAHVVYRLRPGCPALLARTLDHGYTVLSPLDAPAVDDRPAFVGTSVEETGVFEGPVRTGEVLFRYVPPSQSGTWASGPVDVTADVDAVRLGLEEGAARIDALCGPLPVPLTPDPTIPRIPAGDL